ncbi:DsbA family protein [Candidatus Parcubacteria bacterium]|nr:DsbA family protein [Candidatus Parcubacteria bacterium]
MSDDQPIVGGGEGRSFGVPTAIVVAGIIIAGAILWSNQQGRPGQLTATPTGQTGQNGELSPPAAQPPAVDDDPTLGPADAKVTIIEFSDFQCPFCGRFFRDTEPKIVENYVKAGKVRFVYRDLAFLGEESLRAAEAAQCAFEQGKFWEYHDALFTNQSGENEGAFKDDNLKRFARDLKLDSAKFDGCLDSRKYRSEVEKDTDDARLAGATGTPTVFINGRIIVGARPYEDFARVIEEELGK